jgi:hypothetical protein
MRGAVVPVTVDDNGEPEHEPDNGMSLTTTETNDDDEV